MHLFWGRLYLIWVRCDGCARVGKIRQISQVTKLHRVSTKKGGMVGATHASPLRGPGHESARWYTNVCARVPERLEAVDAVALREISHRVCAKNGVHPFW